VNGTPQSKPRDNRRTLLWILASVVMLTFLVLDAGALAWSASLISGRQLTAELFTFFVVLSGAAVTVWGLKTE